MISEIAVLKLQFGASIFMGYEYFVSASIKARVDNLAKKIAEDHQTQSDAVIKAQLKILKKNMYIYLVTGIAMAIGFGLFKLISVFGTAEHNVWLPFLLGIAALFFLLGAFKSFQDKLLIEALAPMLIPLTKRLLITYLLFTSKGVIAGIGMLLLLASFWARYTNAVGI